VPGQYHGKIEGRVKADDSPWRIDVHIIESDSERKQADHASKGS
jgi:hypothetical protein